MGVGTAFFERESPFMWGSGGSSTKFPALQRLSVPFHDTETHQWVYNKCSSLHERESDDSMGHLYKRRVLVRDRLSALA